MKCHACRQFGASVRIVAGAAAGAFCCDMSAIAVCAPDVAQWLRTRAIRVSWLIYAARHVPGITREATAPAVVVPFSAADWRIPHRYMAGSDERCKRVDAVKGGGRGRRCGLAEVEHHGATELAGTKEGL